jgi:beta-glucosidase
MKGRTYRYFSGTPVYPFGYGLSYTQFSYSTLTVAPLQGAPENGLRVTTTVRNSGARQGDDVAQLYLTPPAAMPGAPRLALRGAQRVSLAPGQSTQVTFELSPRDLSFVTPEGERRLLPGHYQVSVGSGQPGTDVATQTGVYDLKTDTKLPE